MRHRPLRPAVLVAVLVMAATVFAAGRAAPGSAAVGQAPRFPAVLTGAGLIGSQRHVVHQGGLAVVHSRYYSDVPTTGYFSRYGAFAVQWKEVPAVLFQPMKVPRRETEYLTGNPAVRWSDSYQQSFQNLAGGQADTPRIFRAGQRLTEDWNAPAGRDGGRPRVRGAAPC